MLSSQNFYSYRESRIISPNNRYVVLVNSASFLLWPQVERCPVAEESIIMKALTGRLVPVLYANIQSTLCTNGYLPLVVYPLRLLLQECVCVYVFIILFSLSSVHIWLPLDKDGKKRTPAELKLKWSFESPARKTCNVKLANSSLHVSLGVPARGAADTYVISQVIN